MTENKEYRGGWSGNRWRITAWTTAAFLLLFPWLAMQVTDEVQWDEIDFAILGALLVGAGLTYELAIKKTGSHSYRAAVGVALAAAFILIVGNGAVGVIGTSHDKANLMFGGVLTVGFIGAVIGRFKSRGMTRAMFATALTQVLAGLIVLIAGFASTGPIWPMDILMATAFFTALWCVSAWLFRKAESGNGSTISSKRQ